MGTHSVATQATSLILEGVFDVFPDLKFVMIEGGFGWVPHLGWRMDAHWTKDAWRGFRSLETEAIGLSENPISGMRRSQLKNPNTQMICVRLSSGSAGTGLVYSSDYPHWDFDDPHVAWRFQMTATEKRQLLHDNALAVYSFK